MTQTKVIGESVKQTNRTFVKSYVEDYAKAITENYKMNHIESMERMLERDSESRYAAEQLNDIQNGKVNLMYFKVYTGKKYYKIVSREFDTFRDRNEYRDGSVHAFVDKETGDVYKPASWKAPAKHIRYTFQNTDHLKFLLNPKNVGWAGGYLYMR